MLLSKGYTKGWKNLIQIYSLNVKVEIYHFLYQQSVVEKDQKKHYPI